MQSMLTIPQVAKITGKHPETIRRWCWDNKVKSEKKGRDFLIYASEFTPKLTESEKNQKIRDFVFGLSPTYN